ncbi:MAG: ATP-binding protein [Alphaproteobacteria bacterium]
MVDFQGFVRFMRSLFGDQTVFRRELIQNALEACHQARTRYDLSDGLISVTADYGAGQFAISDNGIGMTADELRTNLTVLFRSNWQTQGGTSLGIGQFGFGFHAAFLVADRITVVSRHRGHPGEAHEMDFFVDQGIEIRPVIGALPDFGTTVRLWVRDDTRHVLDVEETRADIKKTFLYTHDPVHLNGFSLGLPRPEEWSKPIFAGNRANIVEWLMRRCKWDEPPLAVGPVKFDNGGWVAIAAENELVPPLEVYRRGVRVVQQELIPKPLNHMVCGVIDVQDCELKPDRVALADGDGLRRMIAAIEAGIVAMLSELGRAEPYVVSRLFGIYRLVTLAALRKNDELMRTIGPHLPVMLFGAEESSTLADVIDGCNSLVWVENPARDRVFADRARRLGRRPVLLLDSDERELVFRICGTRGVTHMSVAEQFLGEMKAKVVPSALTALFRNVVPDGWDVICSEDVDARMPLTVVRLGTGDMSGVRQLLLDALEAVLRGEGIPDLGGHKRESTVAILNRRNRIMALLEQRVNHTQADMELAKLLFFTGRLACDSNISVGEMDEFLGSLADYLNSTAARND